MESKYYDLLDVALTMGRLGEYFHMQALSMILSIPIFQYCTFRHNVTRECVIDETLAASELAHYFCEHKPFSSAHNLFYPEDQYRILQAGDLHHLRRPLIYGNDNHYVGLQYMMHASHTFLFHTPDY